MFISKIADVVFGVEPLYASTKKYFADYLYDGEEFPAFTVKPDPENIARVKKEVPDCLEDYAESLEVFRELAYYLLRRGEGMMIHASAIAVDGEAYLFTALSGTGKSTHARLWRKLLGDRAVMVNDDKPVLRFIDGDFYVYGTPWMGKHYLGNNIKVKVKAICKLERGETDSIEPIPVPEMILALFNQTVRPFDESEVDKLLYLLDKLLSTVKTYRLKCTPTLHAAELSYKIMSGGAQ